MFEYALAIALEVSEARNQPVKEPPSIVLTEPQRMAIMHMIQQIQRERAEAEERALFWYRKSIECSSKTQI